MVEKSSPLRKTAAPLNARLDLSVGTAAIKGWIGLTRTPALVNAEAGARQHSKLRSRFRRACLLRTPLQPGPLVRLRARAVHC